MSKKSLLLLIVLVLLTGCLPVQNSDTLIVEEGQTYQADRASDIEVYVESMIAGFIDGDLTVYLPQGAERVVLVRQPKEDLGCRSYVEFYNDEVLYNWSLCVTVGDNPVVVRDIYVKTR